MQDTTQELLRITKAFTAKINDLSDEEFAAKPLPHKWSKKEVLGHLVDSAENNLRRFVCAQYTEVPPRIMYDQDFWVHAKDYAHTSKEDVLQHWRIINDRICSVLNRMPPENYSKMCGTSPDPSGLRSLEWLAKDYVKHMKHHLNQIIPGSFDLVYP